MITLNPFSPKVCPLCFMTVRIPIQNLEREPQFPLEFGDVAALVGFDEANREAFLAGSRGASGAVRVVLQVLGQLTVDHE